MTRASPFALSPEDRARLDAIARLDATPDAAAALAAHLDDPSWAVRRAVVAALARRGDAAVPVLCAMLATRRESEARVAAVVDALCASRGDVETALLALATDATPPAILCDVAQVFARRRSERGAELLARLTRHADDNVAVGAIEALGRLAGRAALDALTAAAASENFFRAFPAIEALGRTGDPRAVATLAARLDEPLYALEAARALGRAGELDVVAPLARRLGAPSDALVRGAAAALVEIDARYRARFGVADAVADAARAAVRAETAARQLARCIPGAEPTEQAALCRVLTWIGGASAASSLIDLLGAEPSVASAARDALASLGRDVEPDVVLALREPDSDRRRVLLPLVRGGAGGVADVAACLDDPDAAVRALAAEALGRAGDPSAVGALFDHLGETDARTANAILGAIQSLGSDETERRTLAGVRAADPVVRRASLRVLAYLGYTRGLDALLAAVDDPDERVRDAAIYGLPLIEEPRALDALLAAASHTASRTRAAAMRALGQSTDAPRVLARLRDGLADDDAWVRYYACQSLGRLRDEAATEALVARLDDAAGQVRLSAIEALAHVGGERSYAALREAASSSDADVQRAALVALGIARPPSTLPLLLAAAEGPDVATRLIALSALAEFDAPEVLPALARAAVSDDEAVRDAAVGFLAARSGLAATQTLVALLDEPARRGRVVDALATPATGRVPGVLAALETADDELAQVLASALARARRADARAALAVALAFDRAPPRRAAAAVLAALGAPEARAALARAASDDPDPEVRRLAAGAARA